MEKVILLVEDEYDIRLGLTIDLESNGGYKVWEAGDHPEAIKTLENRGIPHVILTDVMMPSSQQAGLALIQEVKKNPLWSDIPIVVLSAKGTSGDILEALRLGAMDYLVKPCGVADLLERVERAYQLSLRLSSQQESTPKEENPLKQIRKLHCETLKLALLYWELTTGKSKVDFALESELWSTYVSQAGSYNARTLDRYLHEHTLPKKPRAQLVVNSVNYILKHSPEDPALREQLEKSLKKLTDAIS